MANFDGSSILDWIKAIVGNLFIAILIVRTVGQYARSDWGEMMMSLGAAIGVVGVIYFPDQVIGLLKKLFGGASGSAMGLY